ncbi:hypothetical protein [Streptomyces sp. AS02]|uniref:hypothetical protein n=1 Tax=Streptomyces sp. AS02 TaxID=2938946 RepID=UPI0020213314|nr:hypothetical protein [Streptomyces sp. AS02]MCL8014906.1 hypothetical protein [Streptomyces sp. AS02]
MQWAGHDPRRRRTRRDRLGGIVVSLGEFEHGVIEYAVPVRDTDGRIGAVLSLVGRPHDRLPHERTIRTDLTPAAVALADAIEDGGGRPR